MDSKAVVLMLVIAVAGTSLATEPVPKAAWQWSAEERIASRTSGELARQRMRPSNAEQRGHVDRFTGKTHRELFLPYEVFESLVDMGFGGDDRAIETGQEGFAPDLRRHGLPADFWKRLRSLSVLYRADVQAVRQLGPSSGDDVRALKNAELCRSRADALEAARVEFGRERFDRFLYEVIAVKMFYFADRLPDPAVLRTLDGGCR